MFLLYFLAKNEASKSNEKATKSAKPKKNNTLSVIDRLEMPSTPRLAMKSPKSPRRNSLVDPKIEMTRKNKQLFTPQVKKR